MVNTKLGLILIVLLAFGILSYAADAALGAGPNLVVKVVKAYPKVIYVESDSNTKGFKTQKVGYTFVVANNGNAPAPMSAASVIQILPNRNWAGHGWHGVKQLNPMQFYMLPVNNPPPLPASIAVGADVAGTHILRVCADAGKQIAEISERDNCSQTTFEVKVK